MSGDEKLVTLVDNEPGDIMNILMIAPEPFFEPRGTPISIMQRLIALSSLGHSIDLLTYPVGKDLEIPGVTYFRAPSFGLIKDVKIGPSFKKLFLDVLLMLRGFALLATRQYDVIHTHEEASFFTIFLSWFFRVPHLYDMHSSLPNQLKNFNYGHLWPAVKLFQILERWVLKTCEAVITIDSELESYTLNINPGINGLQIENLPLTNGFQPSDPEALEALKLRHGLEGKIPVVYTGTLELYQGVDLLLESASLVSRAIPEVVFIIVGGRESQVSYYTGLAQKFGVEDRCIFVGNVPPEEALLYLSLSEVLVSPRKDGTSIPLKIYSYLSSGKPIIATRTEANTRLLQEDFALLVEPNKEDFANGISRLILQPELRKRLSENSIRFASKIQNKADYIAKVDKIYRTLEQKKYPTKVSSQPIKD